jgi:hypothetical protein
MNGAGEVIEKKKKKKESFVFYIPISAYNLLIWTRGALSFVITAFGVGLIQPMDKPSTG